MTPFSEGRSIRLVSLPKCPPPENSATGPSEYQASPVNLNCSMDSALKVLRSLGALRALVPNGGWKGTRAVLGRRVIDGGRKGMPQIANEGMPFRVRICIILRDVVRPVSPLFAAVVLFGLDLLGDFEVHNSKEPLPRFLMPGPGIKVKARRGHERSTGQALRLNHSHFQPCQDRTRLKKARRRANLRGVVCETHRIKLRTGQLRPDLTK